MALTSLRWLLAGDCAQFCEYGNIAYVNLRCGVTAYVGSNGLSCEIHELMLGVYQRNSIRRVSCFQMTTSRRRYDVGSRKVAARAKRLACALAVRCQLRPRPLCRYNNGPLHYGLVLYRPNRSDATHHHGRGHGADLGCVRRPTSNCLLSRSNAPDFASRHCSCPTTLSRICHTLQAHFTLVRNIHSD